MKQAFRKIFYRATLFAPLLAGAPALAGSVSTTLPDTEAGRIGAAVIAQINAGSPEQTGQWAPTILSSAFDQAAKEAILTQLAVAARESGGVDFVDARTQGPPGMLVVTIKARRTGQLAALVLLPDPTQPGKLAMADLAPVDPPELYAGWPKAAASRTRSRASPRARSTDWQTPPISLGASRYRTAPRRSSTSAVALPTGASAH